MDQNFDQKLILSFNNYNILQNYILTFIVKGY